MTEQEEFEFRHRLEQEKSLQSMMQDSQKTPPAQDQTLSEEFQGAAKKLLAPAAYVADKMHPKNLTWTLPMGGAMLGTAIEPGAGTAVGAGLGSIAQKMANIAFGTTPPVQPTTSVAGIPMAPKEAIMPMLNAATGGLPETTEGQAVGQKVSDAYQSLKPGFKKTLSQIVQMTTGKPAAKVRQIIEDPTAVLPESYGGSKSVDAASSQIGQALDESGMQKKLYGPFSEGKAAADADANRIYAMWKNGEPITAQEAYNAKRATDKLWPSVVKERNAEDIREMSQFKTGMDDILSNLKGKFLNASKDYARARLGSDFTQVLPRTKTGDISTVKSFLLPMVEPRKIPYMLASSPAVFGAANLGTQATMKAFNAIGNNPSARQALMGLLQQLIQKPNTPSNP